MKYYETYMKKCFELAKLAEGKTSPNPLVGCVVLNKDGDEISSGFHSKYGENHAERDALLKVSKAETQGGEIIVNLEPCSHFGKTPPCADLIIEYGLSKVVIGTKDINPIVSGNGIKKLKEAGIEVIEGVLEEEARQLNEVFLKNIEEKKTFIALKTASTLDGKIATKTGSSKWITSTLAREEVKKIRSRYDAILTSSSTVLADNPTMEHRKKIVLDRGLKTDIQNANIYQNGEIFVFFDKSLTAPKINNDNIKFIPSPSNSNGLCLDFVFENLFELKIMSVLIESGGKLNGSVLSYADKIYHFLAPKITSDNTGKSCFDGAEILDIADCMDFEIKNIEKFAPDILLTYYPISKN